MSTKKVVKATDSTSLPAKFTRKEVPNLIAKLKEKLAALKGNDEVAISLDIAYSNGKKVKDITTVSELLEMSSSIQSRSNAYQNEIKRFGLEDKNISSFKVSDKTAEQWFEIIGKAIKELINKKEIQKAETALTKLSKYLDEETRLANDISSILEDAGEAIV